MAIRSSKKIELYIDAVKTKRALEQAAKDEGLTEARKRAINQAIVNIGESMRIMTGGEISKAKRILDADLSKT